MKITDIRVHVLRSPLAQPFAFSQGWVASRGATLVEVSTDEGVTGWGEALCQGLQPPEIAALPGAHHSLYAQQPLLEFDTSSHPFREHLTDAPLRHKDGWVEVPQRPGLGIEVAREVLKKYSA